MLELVLPDKDKFNNEISLFELEKLLQAAATKMQQIRFSASLPLRPTKTQDHKACYNVLNTIGNQMLQGLEFGMSSMEWESNDGVTATAAVGVAIGAGMDWSALPSTIALSSMFADLGSVGVIEAEGHMTLSRNHLYRALAAVGSAHRQERAETRRTQLSYLASSEACETSTVVFGLGAFVECLLKICFHRLGGKGANEIQRGSPCWWKCAWLLTVCGSAFAERTKTVQYEDRVNNLARDVE